MDLTKANKIPVKYKNLISGYTKRVEILFPTQQPYYHIIDLIKTLILLYFYYGFDSKLLSQDEQVTLLDLLKENNKTIIEHPWKLIFEASTKNFQKSSLIESIYGKQNILILLRVNNNCIIGAYTKTGWDKETQVELEGTDMRCSADKDAFVFYLKSPAGHKPFISNVKQDRSINNALGYCGSYFCIFGSSWIFVLNSEGEFCQLANKNFDAFGHGQNTLIPDWEFGYKRWGETVHIEVFHID